MDISKKGKFRYIAYEDIPSTMDIDPDFDNTVVIAKTQHSGKGRKKNTWVSPKGAVYMTYNKKLPKTFPIQNLAIVQHFPVVAVIEAIDNPKVRAKWPNDIIYDGQFKIGGILVNSSVYKDEIKLKFGLGLNTRLDDEYNFDHIPTLEKLIGFKMTNQELIENITERIYKMVHDFNFNKFKKRYSTLWLHTDVKIKINGQEYRIIGIDDQGYLEVVCLTTNQIHSVDPAENRFDMMNGLILRK